MPAGGEEEDRTTSTILGCDYVSVPVDRLKEAVEFYRDILGLKFLFMTPARWAEFDLGPFVLALYPREADEGRGGEIAFRVGDLPAAMARLSAMGVTFPSGMEEFETPTGRGRLARFRDPSDNKLELVERS